MPAEKQEVLRRRRGPHPQDQQPRQGPLPAHRDHQGRGAQLLRPDRAGAAAAPQGPRRDPDPVAARRGGHELLREERPGRHAVLGAHRDGAPTTGSRARGTARHLSSRSSTTWRRSPGWSTWPPSSCTCTSGRSVRNGRPRNADRLVIDLDPGEPAGLHECCQVALLVRDRLGGARPGDQAGHQRQQGAAPVRRPAEAAALRRVHGAGQGGGRGARRASTPSWSRRR